MVNLNLKAKAVSALHSFKAKTVCAECGRTVKDAFEEIDPGRDATDVW